MGYSPPPPPRCRYSSLLFTMTTGSWSCSHVKRTPFMSLIHCPACPESQRLMVLYQHWRNICNKHLLDLSTASRSYRLNDKITSIIHLPKYSLLVLLLLLPHFCGWFFFSFDCGFHVLLYIKEFHNRNLICSIDKVIQQLQQLYSDLQIP